MNTIRLFLLGCMLLCVLPGCGSKQNPKSAQTAVETALDKWKAGGTAKQLEEKSIEMIDPDWAAGFQLAEYKVKAATNFPQQGPRVVVVLTLHKAASKRFEREVAYEVLLKDKIHIGRDAFHRP